MTPDIGLANWFRQRALRSPERKALRFEGQDWTYAEMEQAIEACAARLAALGIREVASASPFFGLNQPMFFLAMFAAALTTGVLAMQPMPGSASVSMINAALEGFVRAAALEMPRAIRINAVSPPWVKETLMKFGIRPTVPDRRLARLVHGRQRTNEVGAVDRKEWIFACWH